MGVISIFGDLLDSLIVFRGVSRSLSFSLFGYCLWLLCIRRPGRPYNLIPVVFRSESFPGPVCSCTVGRPLLFFVTLFIAMRACNARMGVAGFCICRLLTGSQKAGILAVSQPLCAFS